MEIEYLNSEHLAGFENYKYSCKDTSPLSIYVMHPFWNKVVLLCPKWVAPNLLTFSGFLFTLATFFMFSIYDYDFYASSENHPEVPPLPKWTFTLAAIFLFLAYTLDGIDGKQARRTGSSGPLGELFDHGLDSYTAALIPVTMFSIFGRSGEYSISSLRMYFILWNILVNFHLSHWEKYNTGVLFLPWGYDVSMWFSIIVFFISGVYGHEVWRFTIGGISAGILFEITLYVSSMASNLPVILYNMYWSYKLRTGHMRSFTEAVRPLVPIVIFLILTSYWAFNSPYILDKDPRALYFLTGTIFSNICCRLIVAQMSHTRAELFNWLLLPTALVVFLSLSFKHQQLELGLTYSLLLVATVAHVHYGTCVVKQMCKHFRINCFKIREHSD